MNRIIKFRAWDKKRKEWMVINQTILNINEDRKIFCLPEEPDLVVMQYTGLKDKNGKEIYEGDILEYPREEMKISIIWNSTGARWCFDEHVSFDDGISRGDRDLTSCMAEDFQIIGNVHENPELI